MNPVGTVAHESGTVNHIGFSLYNGFQQFGVLHGVIFQICILNYHHLTGDKSKPGPDGCALAHIPRMINGFGNRFFQGFPDKFRRSVAGTVIHQNNFLVLDGRFHNPLKQC